MFAEQYGPWALIAGGSEGVGESFALSLAAQGVSLVLVARKTGPLEVLAERVRASGSVQVRTLAQDLTAADMLDRVDAATADIDVGLLIYNAGSVSGFSPYLDATLDEQMRMVRLGVVAPTMLSHHFGEKMRARGRGGIILVGSMAGYAGAPDEIVYSAGKAYSRILAEGLWYELKPHNVHVLGLILGLTRTPAMDRLGLNMTNPDFPPDEPAAVVEEGFAHLADGPVWNVGGKADGAKYEQHPPSPGCGIHGQGRQGPARIARSPAGRRGSARPVIGGCYCLAAVKLPVTPWTSMSPFIVLGVSIVPLKVSVAWPASQSHDTALSATVTSDGAPGLPSVVQVAVVLPPAAARVQTVFTALPTTSPVIFHAPVTSSANAAPETESAAKATAKRAVFISIIPLFGVVFDVGTTLRFSGTSDNILLAENAVSTRALSAEARSPQPWMKSPGPK